MANIESMGIGSAGKVGADNGYRFTWLGGGVDGDEEQTSVSSESDGFIWDRSVHVVLEGRADEGPDYPIQ